MTEIDFESAYRETYNKLKIGDYVQILLGVNFQPGVVMDKYLKVAGQSSYKQVFIDVLLDNGDVVECYRCYTLFYPQFNWL